MRGTDVTYIRDIYSTTVPNDLPQEFSVSLKKISDLRYGENPNQPAALYGIENSPLIDFINIRLAKPGKGLSATNNMDITRALDILKYFQNSAVCVMKHALPSGFATDYSNRTSLSELYVKARDADARAAFGSVVVSNKPIDTDTAKSISSTFVEIVAAPAYELGALQYFENKKNMRVVLYSNLDKLPKYDGDDTFGLYDMKMLPTGIVVIQKPFLSKIKGKESLIFDPMVTEKDVKYVVARDPTDNELNDLLTAWYVNIGVRSNGIVIVKDGVTVAVGSGQQERVGALEQAIVKAYQKAMDREGIKYDAVNGAVSREYLDSETLSGSVVSSDAFFPFRDSIDTMAEHGISAVIQPGGSVRDYEVIDAANEHEMAMVYTAERCFAHF